MLKMKISYNHYAPQVGLDEEAISKFWEDTNALVQGIHSDHKIFVGGDLQAHVTCGSNEDGFERVHEESGFGYRNRNEKGKTILEFAPIYDFGK